MTIKFKKLIKQSGFMLQMFPSVHKSYHHEDSYGVILKKKTIKTILFLIINNVFITFSQ